MAKHEFLIPIKLVSEPNQQNRTHISHRIQWARRKRQRNVSLAATIVALAEAPDVDGPRVGVRVSLTRIAPRRMDDDNLIASFKACRDGIALGLGLDDRFIAWSYAQRRGEPRHNSVEVEIDYGNTDVLG